MHTAPFLINQQTYDQIARRYAEINAQMPAELESAGERFLALIPPKSRILDLGCGPGRDLAWFEACGASGYGADLSAGMLAEARKAVKSPLAQANMLQLSFKDGSFGGVWCSAALLHLPKASLPEVLLGIRRVLYPGGLFFAGLKQGQGEGLETWSMPGEPQFERFFAYYQPEQLAELLQNAAFTIVDHGINVTPRVNWIWFLCRKP